jgi:hypothetical protein
MKEGLLKTSSLLAIAVAGGMVMTTVSAFAADLGGNCCADLEERVAELEATTARKGTRKTSLEIWGDVNKEIIAYNDGISKNTFLGEDNVNFSTRLGLRGMAKVTPSVTAGYSIVIEQNTGARSTNVSQFNDKKTLAIQGGSAGYNASDSGGTYVNDAGVSMREANWWIESDRLGRMTVGRFNGGNGSFAGPVGMIDIASIGAGAAGASSVNGSSLQFRNNAAGTSAVVSGTGNMMKYTIGNVTDSAGEYGTRQNGVAYSTPTWNGLSLAASIAGAAQSSDTCSNFQGGVCINNEDFGTTWSYAAKYANEFHGFRIAASAAWEESKQENQTSITAVNPANPPSSSYRPDAINKGLSLSMLHVPSGLFLTGFMNWYTRGHDTFTQAGASTAVTSDTARQWWIQGGITKNWFGIGNTTPYAEYQRTTNGYNTFGLEGVAGDVSTGAGASISGGTYAGDNTTLTMWGLGVAQNIDAAAMQLYAGYRNYSLSSDNCSANGGCKDIGLFVAGAQIKF